MHYEYLSKVIGGPDPAARAVSEWTIETLTGVTEGRLPVRAVTHPLGFTCLPVERAGPRGVCVHLWSPRVPRAAPTTSAIHAHCWRLTSIALFGQLENRLLTLADAGAKSDAGVGTYRLLEVRSHGDLDELRPTPRLVECLPGPLQVIAAGDVYSMPAGVFHLTEVPPSAETATVVLGSTVPGAADQSLGPPHAAAHQVRRERCDAARTAAAARVVLDRLATPTARWRRTR